MASKSNFGTTKSIKTVCLPMIHSERESRTLVPDRTWNGVAQNQNREHLDETSSTSAERGVQGLELLKDFRAKTAGLAGFPFVLSNGYGLGSEDDMRYHPLDIVRCNYSRWIIMLNGLKGPCPDYADLLLNISPWTSIMDSCADRFIFTFNLFCVGKKKKKIWCYSNSFFFFFGQQLFMITCLHLNLA